MKWFKHDSDASQDAKIRKLILRHGAEGYAIYFHCLELVAGDVSESNITFELEHDAEVIADNLKIKSDSNTPSNLKVETIMKYILSLGLFEASNGKIYCLKMAKRIDKSMIRNEQIKYIANNSMDIHGESLKISENTRKVMPEEKRREEKRIEQKRKEEKKDSSELLQNSEPISDRILEYMIPIISGEHEPIFQDEIENWGNAYPACDIKQEIFKMSAWLEANPTKKKTRKGVRAFIVRWLSKTQDNGGTKGVAKPLDPAKPKSRYQAYQAPEMTDDEIDAMLIAEAEEMK